MKKNILKITVLGVLFVAVMLLFPYFKYEENHYTDVLFENIDYNPMMSDIFDNYYVDSLEVVKNMEDLKWFKSKYQQIYKMQFLDFLSNDSSLLHYIPVYDIDTKKREAFLLLSSGIDGKIDNNITWKDTLYKHQIRNKVALYNDTDFTDFYLLDSSIYVSYINYLIGKKDVLVMYGSCFEYYKKLCRGIYDVESFISLQNKVFGKSGFINLMVTDYQYKDNNLFIYREKTKIQITFTQNKLPFKLFTDTIHITGHFINVGNKSNDIKIDNAVIW